MTCYLPHSDESFAETLVAIQNDIYHCAYYYFFKVFPVAYIQIDDVVQSLNLYLWENCQDKEFNRYTLKGYVRAAMPNQFRMIIRVQSRSPLVQIPDDMWSELSAPTPTKRKELPLKYYKYLSEKQREAVDFYLSDVPLKTASLLIGKSTQCVPDRFKKAKQRLKNFILKGGI